MTPSVQSIEPSDRNIALAKRFLFTKWRERAKELDHEEPADVSRSCKFSATFAAAIFGGRIEANIFHVWTRLPNDDVLDLNEDAADVRALKAGEVPDYAKAMIAALGIPVPYNVHSPDRSLMRTQDFKDSIASTRPRVMSWVLQFHQFNDKMTHDSHNQIGTDDCKQSTNRR